MAEEESRHRQFLEKSTIQAQFEAQELQIAKTFRSDSIGQYIGGAVSVLCIVGCVYLAMNDREWVVTALVSLPLAAIIRALRDKSR